MSEKYYCVHCNNSFDEEEGIYKVSWSNSNYIGHGGGFPDISFKCPYCGSEEVEEAKYCPICGEYHIDEGDYCDACIEFYTPRVKEFIEKIAEETNSDDTDVVGLLTAIIENEY